MILWPAVSLRVGLMETGHWLGMNMAGFCISFAMYREEGHTLGGQLRDGLSMLLGGH